MALDLAEEIMRAAIVRSKSFNLLAFTNNSLCPLHRGEIYLRNRESFLPASYDDDDQQQNAKAGVVERNLHPGKWIPENIAKYHLQDYGFLQQPSSVLLQNLIN